MKKETAAGKTSEESLLSTLEWDGPFLADIFPNTKTWRVMAINIKEKVLGINWLTPEEGVSVGISPWPSFAQCHCVF